MKRASLRSLPNPEALQAQPRRRKLSWAWLNAYPRAMVAVRDSKAYLRQKLMKNYGVHR